MTNPRLARLAQSIFGILQSIFGNHRYFPYLDKLPLSRAQKLAITDEGYENAFTLYIVVKITPTAMQEFLAIDENELKGLEDAIWAILSEDEREQAEEELKQLPKL